MSTQTVALTALDDLRGNPRNPKTHDAAMLDRSISRYGYVEPIVIDDRTGFLISGHGRAESLRRMRNEGKQAPDGITVTPDGTWLVPTVRGWSSADDAQADAVLIALNRTTELGGWDGPNLKVLLEELQTHDGGLEAVGYTDADLLILQRLAEAEGTFGISQEQVVDEFLDMTGLDGAIVDLQYESVLRVYFQTTEARKAFYAVLGYEYDKDGKTLRYPATFIRHATPMMSADG